MYGDEQADAGRDCRTRLVGLSSQGRTETGKYSFSQFQLTSSKIGNHNRSIFLLLYVIDYTYMYTYIPVAPVAQLVTSYNLLTGWDVRLNPWDFSSLKINK